MDNGFIILHRKIANWEWYQNTNVVRVFLHLLIMANHQDNKWQGILVKRGQRITSYANIANELGDISLRQVRTALDKLKMTGELTIKPTNKYSLITINNYDYYQSVDKQTARKKTGKRQADDIQLTTNNNDNNDNNDNNIKEREFSNFEDLTDTVVQEIADYYEVPFDFVEEKRMDMEVWLGKKRSNKYKNYRLALMKWVRDDKKRLMLEVNKFKNNRGGVVDARE